MHEISFANECPITNSCLRPSQRISCELNGTRNMFSTAFGMGSNRQYAKTTEYIINLCYKKNKEPRIHVVILDYGNSCMLQTIRYASNEHRTCHQGALLEGL